MAINVNILDLEGNPLDGSAVSQYGTLNGVVSVENDEASTLGVSGVQMIATGQTEGFDASTLELSIIDTNVYGNANTGSVLSTIAAGETGSFYFTIRPKCNMLSFLDSAQFSIDALTVFNNSPASSSILNQPCYIQVYPEGSPPEAAFIVSPTLSWSLSNNHRPVTNYDFDFALNTVFLGSDKIIENQPPPLASDYTSSNTAVLSVVSSGDYSVATANGMAKMVGGAGAVTVVGLGTATIQNRIADGVTGSVVITVTA